MFERRSKRSVTTIKKCSDYIQRYYESSKCKLIIFSFYDNNNDNKFLVKFKLIFDKLDFCRLHTEFSSLSANDESFRGIEHSSFTA